MDGRNRRPRQQPGQNRRQRSHRQTRRHRTARLPDALCGGVVDGDSMGWLSAREARRLRRSEARGEIPQADHPARSEKHARPAERVFSSGPTSRACASTRRTTSWRSSPPAFTASRSPTRTARRFASSTPWKYGFKGVKSIVKIEFVAKQPHNTWSIMAPERIRFLRQRESQRGSPAMVAGERARHRRWRSSSRTGKRPSCLMATKSRSPRVQGSRPRKGSIEVKISPCLPFCHRAVP